jgi:penicillin-binding protein 1A
MHRNKKVKKMRKGKKSKWIIIPGILIALLVLFSIYIFSGVPSLEELENPRPNLASKVYTADGELLGQFFIENRIETDLDSLPPHLINALIATEDRKFFDHWGVNLPRFFKAMIKNIVTFSREGASTITQQLAKNLYELKTLEENEIDVGVRKIREWISAIQIEKRFTKKEILELYLNVSYFGKSAYRNYDPVSNYDIAIGRRNLVMHNMVVTGMLDEQEYEKLKEKPIVLNAESMSLLKADAPHFLEYLRQQLSDLADEYDYDLYRDGLNIYTTLNLEMQKIANTVTAKHIEEYQKLFNEKWKWSRNKDLLASLIDKAVKESRLYRNAETADEKAMVYNSLKNNEAFVDSVKAIATTVEVGFVVIDPKTGYIEALIGGENQEFGRGLNHVTGIKRQPGSSFKPFVYTTAIENGYFPAYTLLNQKFDYNTWSPSNSDGEYNGYETLRLGLAKSLNVITGRMTISEIAPPNQVVKIAQRMGIKSHLDPFPSIALGTSEITPLEITSAFGTFVNGGVHTEPISILKIEDKNGIIIEQFVPEVVQAISSETASIIVDMMKDVVAYGTGADVRRYFQYPAAGKTGTTQDYSDAWFVGYTPNLVGGVWVGFDDHRVKFTDWYGQGAKASLPIWAMFMEEAYKNLNIPVEYFELAEGIETAMFCKETIDLGDSRIASEYCLETVEDIVKMNQIPPVCEIHTDYNRIIRENNRGDSDW